MRSVIATEVIPNIMHARRGGRVMSGEIRCTRTVRPVRATPTEHLTEVYRPQRATASVNRAMKPSQCDINLMTESASLTLWFVQLVHVRDAAKLVYRRSHNTVVF